MTDHYSLCEDSLAALFRTLTAYFKHDWQVSDDDSNVNKGADYHITFNPGQFQELKNDGANSIYNWEVLFELRVRFLQIGTSKAKFKAIRSDLFNVVNAHRRLNYPTKTSNGVLDSKLTATTKMQYWYDDPKNKAPSWIIQSFKADVTQVVSLG